MGILIAYAIATPVNNADLLCSINQADPCALRGVMNRPSLHARIFDDLVKGVPLTLRVAFGGYVGAILIGLIIGVIRSDPPKPGHGLIGGLVSLIRLAIYQAVTLYVEVLRGIPTLIVLLVAAYIIVPELRDFMVDKFGIGKDIRGGSELTAIIGLAMVYGAFMSETFRAGIISIDKGQREAARSLGMTYGQMMRHIVLPQAIRRILPPLGNDLVSIIKDSSLVTVFGLRDITQTAKVVSGSNFQTIPTYAITVYIYLILTFTAGLFAKWIERRVSPRAR
jgi:polar amino acid transport system permease protein